MPDEIIKRAFDLAGQCGSVDEVRQKLQQEGYFHVQAYLSGPQIIADLRCRLNPELRSGQKKPRELSR